MKISYQWLPQLQKRNSDYIYVDNQNAPKGHYLKIFFFLLPFLLLGALLFGASNPSQPQVEQLSTFEGSWHYLLFTFSDMLSQINLIDGQSPPTSLSSDSVPFVEPASSEASAIIWTSDLHLNKILLSFAILTFIPIICAVVFISILYKLAVMPYK